jgi:hypothetical protein
MRNEGRQIPTQNSEAAGKIRMTCNAAIQFRRREAEVVVSMPLSRARLWISCSCDDRLPSKGADITNIISFEGFHSLWMEASAEGARRIST